MNRTPVSSRFGLAGAVIIGGLALVALSTVYVAHGIFVRLDAIIEIVRSAPAVLKAAEASAERIKVSLDVAGRRIVEARAALPAVGTEIGDAGARAVEAMDGRLTETQPKGRLGTAARGFVDNLKSRDQK